MNCICVRVLHVYLRLFLLGRSKPPRRSRTLHGGGALMLKASKVDVEGATRGSATVCYPRARSALLPRTPQSKRVSSRLKPASRGGR